MTAVLKDNSYGKSAVRLTKVVRRGDVHELFEMSVDTELQGDFKDSYTAGDNRKVVATDSMKNTVYVLAAERAFACIEEFASDLARHFVSSYAQVTTATVSIEQTGWRRIEVNGKPHNHSFSAAGSDRRVCRAVLDRASNTPQLTGGIKDLLILKTTASEFRDFVTDRYRTLKDTSDRIFATSLNATWVYSSAAPEADSCYAAIRGALLTTFATHHSLAVQQTLLAMGEAALAACPGVRSIRLEMPNKHRIPFNLQPFGLPQANEIFVPTDEPFGLITATIDRE